MSCFVITASATTPLDIRYLQSKGQEHIYLGGETATAPAVDGIVSSGEYPTSQAATLNGCPENVIKDVKIDGVSVGAVDHYEFVAVDRDHTVLVEYELDAMVIIVPSIIGAILLISIAFLAVILIKKYKRNKA